MPSTSAIGELVVKFTADIADILANTEKVKDTLEEWNKSATSAIEGFKDSVQSITEVFGIYETLKHTVVDSVIAFSDLEAASNRLSVGLQVTGNAAGTSVAEITALGEAIAETTNYTVQGTLQAASALTKYTAVSGDTFQRALKDSADLAAIMGTDLPEAANLLGRALENAFSATQLRRVGLLDDAQVAYLKALQAAGDETGRQNALLDILEEKSQGAAVAIGSQGLASAFNQLGTQLKTDSESFGESIAKMLDLEAVVRDTTSALQALQQVQKQGLTNAVDKSLADQYSYLDTAVKDTDADVAGLVPTVESATKAVADFWGQASGVAGSDAHIVAIANAFNKARDAALGAETAAINNAVEAGKALDNQTKKTEGYAGALQKLTADSAAIPAIMTLIQTRADAAGVSIEAMTRKMAAAQTITSTGQEFAAQLKAIDDAHKAVIANLDVEEKERQADADTQLKDLDFLNKSKLISESTFLQQKAALDEAAAQREYDLTVAKEVDAYNKILDLQTKLAQAPDSQKRLEVQTQLDAAEDAFSVSIGNAYVAQTKLNQAGTEGPRAQLQLQAQQLSAQNQINDTYNKFVNTLDLANQKQLNSVQDLGLSKAAQAGLNAELTTTNSIQTYALTLTQKLHDAQSQNQPELAQQYQDLLDKLNLMAPAYVAAAGAAAQFAEAAKEAVADQTTAWQSILTEANTVFDSIANKGKTTWQDLTQWLKDTLVKELLQLAESQFIVPIILQISGASVAGSIASSLASSLGSNPLSLLNNSITNLSSGVSAIGDLFSGNFAGGWGAATAALPEFTDGIGSAVGELATFGSTLGAAVPVIGLAALGIGLLFSSGIFGSPGGPKVGGSASTGNVSALTDLGTGNAGTGPFFTPNQADALLQTTVNTVATTFATTLAQLGGTAAAAGFALGYDTDPQGTAGNRISAGVTIGGKQVFQQQNVAAGTTDAQLQSGLTLEAQRAILAALQASNLPKDIASLLNAVDASTATADQITAVEQVAATYEQINATIADLSANVQKHFTDLLDGTQATADGVLLVTNVLKSFTSSMKGVQSQMEKLDVTQIQDFVTALGGVQAATSSFTYLYENFTTSAQKATDASKFLNDSFAALGLQVPKTHAAFLDLLASIDLTTAAGRAEYAAVLALAPAYVAVNGTADQATTSLTTLAQKIQAVKDAADQLSGSALTSAQDYFNQNFLTQTQQDQLTIKTNTDALNVSFDAFSKQLHRLGYDEIPTTTAGFAALVAAVARVYGTNSDLYKALLLDAPAVEGVVTATKDLTNAAEIAADALAAATSASLSTADTASQKFVNTFLTNIQALADKVAPSDFGTVTGFKIGLITDQINTLQAQYNNYVTNVTHGVIDITADTIQEEIDSLKGTNSSLADQLAQFTILNAQYGSDIANNLVQLQAWYDSQKQILHGNTDALNALNTVFQEQWTAIINGTSTGVSDTQTALQKLQATIFAFVQSLEVGTLSPLTPLQQLTTAQANYNSILAAAQTGDQTALGNIDAAAQTYLTQARAVDASSAAYTSIFNSVIDSLTALAGPASNIVVDGSGFADTTATMASAIAGYGSAAVQATQAINAASASAAAATQNTNKTLNTLPTAPILVGGQPGTATPQISLTALNNALPAGGKLTSSSDVTALGVKVDNVSKHVQELQTVVMALNSASDSRTAKNIAAQKQSTAAVVANLPRKGK